MCRRFVALCRNLHLLDDTRVAIDGSKFKAVNNREKNFTHERLKRRMAAIDEGIARYLAELDRADRQAAVTGAPIPASKVAELTVRIDKLKTRLQSLAALEAKLVASGENQISLTDPDARAMTSKSHSAYTVGYNVQSAVDTKHHLIVTHEVTNIGIDKDQLSPMAEKARDALDAETIEVLADKGYFNGEEIAACDAAGIEVYVQSLLHRTRARRGGSTRTSSSTIENDHYVCPAGQHLTRRMTVEEKGRTMHVYWDHMRRLSTKERLHYGQTTPRPAMGTRGSA